MGGRCIVEGCTVAASRGYGEHDTHCSDHAMQGMVANIKRRCRIIHCMRVATHASNGDVARYCDTHSTPSMYFYKDALMCVHEGCHTTAVYGLPDEHDEIVSKFCFKHRPKGSASLFCKWCNAEGMRRRLTCIRTSQGSPITMRCIVHKGCGIPMRDEPDTADEDEPEGGRQATAALHTEDICESCDRLANYGTVIIRGKVRAVRCSGHKLPGDKSNRNLYCTVRSGCRRRASFGYPPKDPEKTPLMKACGFHRTPNMTASTLHTICEEEGCGKMATMCMDSNKRSIKSSTRCMTHKLPGMVAYNRNSCQYAGCTTRASYKLLDPAATNMTQACSKHKTPEMTSILLLSRAAHRQHHPDSDDSAAAVAERSKCSGAKPPVKKAKVSKAPATAAAATEKSVAVAAASVVTEASATEASAVVAAAPAVTEASATEASAVVAPAVIEASTTEASAVVAAAPAVTEKSVAVATATAATEFAAMSVPPDPIPINSTCAVAAQSVWSPDEFTMPEAELCDKNSFLYLSNMDQPYHEPATGPFLFTESAAAAASQGTESYFANIIPKTIICTVPGCPNTSSGSEDGCWDGSSLSSMCYEHIWDYVVLRPIINSQVKRAMCFGGGLPTVGNPDLRAEP